MSKFKNLNSNEIINPFFVELTNNINMKEVNLNSNFILIFCMKDNYIKSNEDNILFDLIVDKENFKKLCKKISIVKSSIDLLLNNNFKSIIKEVSSDILNELFPDYTFNNIELILPQFELKENLVYMNISLYNKPYNINHLSDFVQLITYYNFNSIQYVINNFINNIINFDNAQFWTQKSNCENINITNTFLIRNFQHEQKNNQKNNKEFDNSYDNYLYTIHNTQINTEINTKINTLDIFSIIQSDKNRTYYINNNLSVSQDEINNIFKILLNEEIIFNIFNMLLVSKTYCHMALNSFVLDKVKPIMHKYMPFYKYIFGYTWLCMIIEESIIKSNTTKNDRFIFTIDNVNKFPYFPFTYEDIFQNPYIILPIENEILNIPNNILTFSHLANGEQYYGVCNLQEFKFRMNLFISRNSHIDIFKGLNWEFFGITGSIITACAQKKSPLFDIVTNGETNDEQNWLIFFNHYYNESDVDLMCQSTLTYDFLEKCDYVIKIIENNIKKKLNVKPQKKMITYITKEFLIECCDKFNTQFNTSYTFDELYNLIQNDTNKIHFYIYNIYYEHKKK